jgi:hypothetical protein
VKSDGERTAEFLKGKVAVRTTDATPGGRLFSNHILRVQLMSNQLVLPRMAVDVYMTKPRRRVNAAITKLTNCFYFPSIYQYEA